MLQAQASSLMPEIAPHRATPMQKAECPAIKIVLGCGIFIAISNVRGEMKDEEAIPYRSNYGIVNHK